MILETKEEKDAFKFVCELASETTSRRGCNDLSDDDIQKFGHLKVETYDPYEKKTEMVNVRMDFDILSWLERQVR